MPPFKPFASTANCPGSGKYRVLLIWNWCLITWNDQWCDIFARGCSLPSVFIALLPFQPELQSMAASFHGSANIRCVSSPSGGLSSRRAYLSVAALFGFHGRSNIYYVISFDSSSTVLGYLRSSPVSEVSENTRTPAQKSPPPAGACHRPPPIRFPSFVMRVQMRFSIPVQQFLIHGRTANIILVKKKKQVFRIRM